VYQLEAELQTFVEARILWFASAEGAYQDWALVDGLDQTWLASGGRLHCTRNGFDSEEGAVRESLQKAERELANLDRAMRTAKANFEAIQDRLAAINPSTRT
jgi:hypothetical protein